jgi:hypothetical protein
VNVAAPQVQLWDESLWDELLAYVEEGRVIPIVGPTWVVEDQGQRTTVESYVATRLAAKVALPAAAGDARVTLNGVVSRYLQQGKHEIILALVGNARNIVLPSETRSVADGRPPGRFMGSRPSTTLADLFKLHFRADPFSAVRASAR